MILGLDIGNTHIRCGFFPDGNIPLAVYAADTKEILCENDLSRLTAQWLSDFSSAHPSLPRPQGSVYSSVIPKLNGFFDSVLFSVAGKPPVRVSSASHTGFTIRYDDPSLLGADRITNAAAAFFLFPGEDIVVADIGTAATFCVLLRERVFDGGIIAPGPGISAAALAEKTSQLFRVSVKPPVPLIGRNTEAGIRSGIFYSALSMTEGIVSRIEQEYSRHFRLVMTGGGAEMIHSHMRRQCGYDPLLTMKGLNIIYHNS
ncbi:MAG: type III pantothenate kinase [Spirochaetota bacterium]